MYSKRSIRFRRRNPSRRLAAAGAAWLVAGMALGPVAATPAVGAPAAGTAGYTLTWTEAHPAASPPSLRDAAAAFDADTSTVVLFGGTSSSGALSNDTWVWDGRTWIEHPASSMTQAPPARQDASMAFDPALHQLILFGGEGSGGSLLGDTWAWNGASWFQLPPGPSGGPGARQAAALAMGPNGNLVLFGGVGPAVLAAAPTTTPTTAPPTGAAGAPTGASATPTGASATPTAGSAAPSGSSTPQAAATPAFTLLGDTWQWTDKGWAPVAVPGPSPRWGAALAYDSSDRTTVLYAGDTAAPGDPAMVASDTWTWNGAGWVRQTPAASPPGRFDAVMADDPAAGGVALLSGDTGAGVLSDGWLWSGSDWSQAGGSKAPGRSGAAGAYDQTRAAVVVFGGAGPGGTSLGDTELVTTAPPAASSPTTAAPTPTTTPVTAGVPSSPTTAPAGPGPTPTTVERPTTAPTTTGGATRPSTATGSQMATPGPATMVLQTSLHNVRKGASVRLAGSGFGPGTPVTITFHSTPALVGRIIAGPTGDFTTTVSVPATASPGEHHFVATGVDPEGRPTSLLASVFVLAPARHPGSSLTVTMAMVGLALLIPGGAWLAMNGAGRWRRRTRRNPTGA